MYSAPLKEISRAPSSIESYDGDKELANRERLKEWDKEEEWDEEKERKRKEEKRKQKKKEIRCKEEAPKNDDIERMTRDIKHELNEEEKNIINTNKEKVEEWMKGHLKEIGKERKRSGRTVTGCLGKGGEEEQENWEKKRYVRRQSTRDIEYNKEGSSADDERYEKKKHCKEGPYRHAPSNSWSRGRDKRLGSRIYYKGGDEEGGYRNRDSHKHTARNSRSRTRNARSKSKIRYKEEYEQNEHNKERGSHKNTTRNSRSRIRGNRSRSRTHRDERHERDEYSSEGGSHDRDACDYRPKSRSQGKVKSHPSDISLTPLKPVFRSSRDKRATTNSRAHSQQVRENDVSHITSYNSHTV